VLDDAFDMRPSVTFVNTTASPMKILTLFLFVFSSMYTVDKEEVVVKSFVSKDLTSVYVDISLPVASDVDFTLVKEQGDAIHQWTSQTLQRGRHQISLPLPLSAQGKYVLEIGVDEKVYKQLVFIKG